MPNRRLILPSLLPVLLATSAAGAVDTSEWLCESCPFVTGTSGEYTAGVTYVSDDAARFGDASGYDQQGAYINVDGSGRQASDGLLLRWALEDLGLDSRAASLDAVVGGGLNLSLDYRELPRRVFDTTSSVFVTGGDGRLALPAGWQAAAVTNGFAMLGSSLGNADIGHDRRTLGLGAGLRLSPRLALRADYRRRAIKGNNILGGAGFTQASLLPRAFEHQVDEVDLGATWSGTAGHVSLGWFGSWFSDRDWAVTWDSPFTTLPGAGSGRLAQAPDNFAGQLTASGQLRFNAFDTVVNASAALGRQEQDDVLLPYTINPLIGPAALPRTRLDGKVDTTALAISLSARPHERARVRVSWREDERDNRTPRDTWTRVIVDSFQSGNPEINTPYSYRREHVQATADVDVFDELRLSAGGGRKRLRRDFQEVAAQTEKTGWGALRWRPGNSVEVALRAGNEKRDIDRYDQNAAIALGQNPLLRKYNLAYRYSEYARLRASATLPDTPLTFGLQVRHADDSYSQSVVGLLSGQETTVSGDLDLALGENASLNLLLAWQEIESEQAGSEGFGGSDWRLSGKDEFRSAGLGLRVTEIAGNTELKLDYLRSDGQSDFGMISMAGPSVFPTVDSTHDSVRLTLRYRGSGRVDGTLGLRYDSFDSNDWGLQGVEPATIPAVLTLGADPYNYDLFLIRLGFVYRLGQGAGDAE